MKRNSLLGVWTGTTHNANGWDMKMTLSILQPVDIGSTLGIFSIPMMPCSGAFKVIDIEGNTLVLQAENLQGSCAQADTYCLEQLEDGTLLYISTRDGRETQVVLERTVQD